jgi:hypothetical protein
MVIDEDGNRYLVSDDQPHVVRLNRTDAMLVAGFYEPVPENSWREIDTFFEDVDVTWELTHMHAAREPATASY